MNSNFIYEPPYNYFIFDINNTLYDFKRVAKILTNLKIDENIVRLSNNHFYIFKRDGYELPDVYDELKKHFNDVTLDKNGYYVSFKKEIKNFKRQKKLERIQNDI